LIESKGAANRISVARAGGFFEPNCAATPLKGTSNNDVFFVGLIAGAARW
jgi:hypothetical protein